MIMTTILGLVKHIRSLIWLLLLMMLTACTLLPEPSPVTFYRLPPSHLMSASVFAAGLPRAITLRVNQPETSGLLSGNRIAVIPGPNQLSVYQGARWAASVPVLFRDLLIDTWQQQGKIQHIISDSEALQADIELRGTLRAFYSEYQQGRPVVIIHFDAQLVDPRSRTILASRRFAVNEVSPTTDVAAVVAAFGIAHARLANEMLGWLLAVNISDRHQQ
ncbi:MAG: ABC-type transport auxiliary lipoprotein family protein [Oceanisphaera sp.]|uniref:ABC-type transport auxiliary lipoprotein family protein n=1 Tax=Oceanisphaera sp. TaxID=1929979 RepID=UPI003C710DE1